MESLSPCSWRHAKHVYLFSLSFASWALASTQFVEPVDIILRRGTTSFFPGEAEEKREAERGFGRKNRLG